jgi:hypothetical protein
MKVWFPHPSACTLRIGLCKLSINVAVTAVGNIPLNNRKLPKAVICKILREEQPDSHHLGMAM